MVLKKIGASRHFRPADGSFFDGETRCTLRIYDTLLPGSGVSHILKRRI